jgi:copper chaperone CopZ
MGDAETSTEARTTISVEDFRCTCCAENVLGSVRALDGVLSADLDYHRAELHLD